MACKSVRSLTSGSNLSTHTSHRLTNDRGPSEGPSKLSPEEERGERRRRRNKRKGSRSSPERSGGGERKRRERRHEEEEEEEVVEEEVSGESLEALSFADNSSSSSIMDPQGEYSLANTLQAAALTHNRAVFEERFVELGCLGRGGYGTVYAGYRREDNVPVAIKHVPMAKIAGTPVALDGELSEVPLEVVLLLIVGGGEGRREAGRKGEEEREAPRAAVALLDWYELDQELILVLERPVPSMDLFDYIHERGGYLQEDEAKMFLRQLVMAMKEVHSKGVLHRDIKPENVLVETSSGSGPGSLRLRVLDFGCGCVLRKGSYTEFYGTTQYTPPEWYLHGSYQAMPSTVWQLGVLLYDMVCGDHPFNTRREIISEEPYIKDELSRYCQDLLRRCLAKRPRGRPTLEGMLLHPWLQ